MHHLRRKKYENYPLRELKKLRDDIQAIIDTIEANPPREIDIAAGHPGTPELIYEVLETEGDKNTGKWRQLQTIYCSIDRCPKCPHGPHWYVYRTRKKPNGPKVVFVGTPFFDYAALKGMEKQVRPPLFEGTIEEAKAWMEAEKAKEEDPEGKKE